IGQSDPTYHASVACDTDQSAAFTSALGGQRLQLHAVRGKKRRRTEQDLMSIFFSHHPLAGDGSHRSKMLRRDTKLPRTTQNRLRERMDRALLQRGGAGEKLVFGSAVERKRRRNARRADGQRAGLV